MGELQKLSEQFTLVNTNDFRMDKKVDRHYLFFPRTEIRLKLLEASLTTQNKIHPNTSNSLHWFYKETARFACSGEEIAAITWKYYLKFAIAT